MSDHEKPVYSTPGWSPEMRPGPTKPEPPDEVEPRYRTLSDKMSSGHIELAYRRGVAAGADKLEAAEADLETERMRVVACGAAALANTESSKAERIGRDNPYWSASYGDICDAVDREIALRAERDALKAEVERLRELRRPLSICADYLESMPKYAVEELLSSSRRESWRVVAMRARDALAATKP